MENPTKQSSSTPIENIQQPPLTGREGLDTLKISSSKASGINLIDFLNTPEGKEAMSKKKIVLAGPPRSGKSCLRQGLKDVIKEISNGEVYPYVLTACPDGEGSWFQESMNNDPVLAAKLKADYKSRFTPEFVQRIADSVKNLSLPLNFIDIGGVISPENEKICKDANGVIFICGETAVKNEAIIEWKNFFTKLGIPIVAELYSDYKGNEDIVEEVGKDGVFKGSVHHLERGEKLTNREAIRDLAKFIINLGKENKIDKTEKEAPSKETYLKVALENLQKTSRTARGIVDVSASADKAQKMEGTLTPEATTEITLKNFSALIEYLYEQRNKSFSSSDDLKNFLEDIAKRINKGIVKEGILIREGEDSSKYPYTRIKDLPKVFNEFCTELLKKLNDPKQDPEELAAWLEYRIDLTDHFFADGCGKVAKVISAWVLMKNNHTLPVYRDRKELYANAPTQIRGTDVKTDQEQYEKWLAYYKSLF